MLICLDLTLKVVSNMKIILSFRFVNLMEYKFLKYYALDFLSVCCHVPLFISDVDNLDIFFAFLVIWMRVCQSYWFSQKTNSLYFILFLGCCFYLMIIAFSLFISCHLLLLGVVYLFVLQLSDFSFCCVTSMKSLHSLCVCVDT